MTQKVSKFIISNNSTIQESLSKLVKCGSKCLIVADINYHLLGTLSDGDLRKAILKGKKLSDKISNLFNKKPKILLENEYSTIKAQNLFINCLIDIIPIINKNKKIVKIIRIDDVFKKKASDLKKKNFVPVIIMAGGKGTRLEPFTSILPKPLIPVNGKPIINHIIDKFCDYGAKDFFLSINYKSKILKSFFQESKKFFKINFVEESKPLGTAGSLSKIKKNIKSPFFVTNCDIIINTDYTDILKYHEKNKNYLTLVASFKNFTIPYGDCKINKDGLLQKINEKPIINLLANTGMYVVNKNILKEIPQNTRIDFPELITKLKKKKMKIGVFPISEEAWIDIGQWNEYKKAIEQLNF